MGISSRGKGRIAHKIDHGLDGSHMKVLRIGTRASKLAIRQTELVKEAISEAFPEVAIEVVEITTKGDRILDVTLDKIGGKGVFIKEIEEALLDGRVDIAVHSMKDVPVESPEQLVFAAYSTREDARDCYISREGVAFADLKPGAKVGSSSIRRKIQLERLNPNVSIVPIRGNVNTRLNKMVEERLDGIILAAAGVHRLGLKPLITEYFSEERVIPGVCQGIIGVQCRRDDAFAMACAKAFNDPAAEILALCERAFMKAIDGNCQVPMGAFANYSSSGNVQLIGMYGRGERFEVMTTEVDKSESEHAGEWMGKDIRMKLEECAV